MQEFSSVIASSYDADSLAPMLTEKAREGWTVVSIVAAGTNVVAYLSRDADPDEVESGTADGAEAPAEPATASAAVEEPAGWGAVDEGAAAMETTEQDAPSDDAPEDAPANEDVGTAVTGAAALSDLSTGDTTESAPDADATPEAPAEPDTPAEPDAAPVGDDNGPNDAAAADTEPEAPVEPATPDEEAPAAPADSGVPAGWYADPSGRYELRYWDGTGWTEHVSRAGQQYTDPPVA